MRLRTTIIGTAAVAVLALAPAAQAKGTAYVVGNQNEFGALPIAPDGSLGAATAVPTGMFTPRSVAITPDARHAYITSVNSRIIGFNVTGATPTQVPGSPYNVTDTDGHGIAVTPNGQRLYSVNVNGNNGSASIFDVNPDGSLTKVGGNAPLGYASLGIAIAPSGASLYITNDTTDTVHAYAIAGDGTISQIGTPQPAGATPKGIATSPDGRYAFTAGTGGQINAFPVQGDGTLAAAVSSVNTGKVLQTLAVSQDGRFLYAAEFGVPGAVWAYAIGADGALTPVSGQPFPAVDQTYGIDAAPGARTVYSASFDAANPADRVNGYASGADGALSPLPGSPYDGLIGMEFQSIAITPNQGPTAALSGRVVGNRRGGGGRTIEFNASGSSDSDGGTIASYTWDFGDGTDPETTSSPTISHRYSSRRDYKVTLTVTDDQGCSTQTIHTGQTADCNGSAAARTTWPKLRLLAKKQELSRRVVVKAKTSDDADAVARGRVKVKPKGGTRKSYRLKKFKADLEADEKRKLKPKLSKKAYKRAKKVLQNKGKVKAKVKVKVTDAGDDTVKDRVKVKLTKP